MAEQYTVREAYNIVMGSDVEKRIDVAKRYPMFSQVANALPEFAVDMINAIPNMSARKIERYYQDFLLGKNDAESEDDDDEAEEVVEEPKKKSKRGRPSKKAKPVEDDDDEDDSEDEEDDDEKPKKKRGRPAKKKQPEPDEDDDDDFDFDD